MAAGGGGGASAWAHSIENGGERQKLAQLWHIWLAKAGEGSGILKISAHFCWRSQA